MTALTFESINSSPRRAAVRRQAAPVSRAPRSALPASRSTPDSQAAAAPTLAALASASRAAANAGWRRKGGLAALLGVTLALHAGVIVALHQGGGIDPLPPKAAPPLAIEFAPPPPPPPEPPKPLPQMAKVAPAPAKAPPQLPVVQQAPVDDGPPSANTVQVAQAAPPAPAAAPPAPPPPEPVTEPRGFVGYLNNPAPEYPALAQDRGLQGRVILKVHVLATGKPDNIAVGKSSGHKILDDAAIKAVLAWSFEPAKRGQTPVDGWVSVPLNFKIS
jgi:protein TonB